MDFSFWVSCTVWHVHSLCAYVQAAELSIKFLTTDVAVEVIQVVGPQLAQLKKFNAVSENTRRCS